MTLRLTRFSTFGCCLSQFSCKIMLDLRFSRLFGFLSSEIIPLVTERIRYNYFDATSSAYGSLLLKMIAMVAIIVMVAMIAMVVEFLTFGLGINGP